MSKPALREVRTDGERIMLEIDLAAASEHAYRYWTEPELVARWWAPATSFDASAGTFRYSWPQQDWHLAGRVLSADPGRELRLTWHWEHEPQRPERELAVRFAADGGGTRLRLEHGPYGDAPGDADERREHLEGWRHFLPRLAEAVSG